MTSRWFGQFAVAACLMTAGCNQAQPPTPVVDLVVDSNRSGLLEPGDATEETGKDTWDDKHGAVFLANLDDDDKDGTPDAEDEVVNGKSDIQDLAPIAIRAWDKVPLTATGVVSVDATSATMVRIFRVTGPSDDPASYHVETDPTKIALSNADLLAGVQLAIESRDFVTSTAADAWTGMVQLTLTVTDPKAKDPLKQTLTDAAKLRVAPLLLQYNTLPTENVFFTDAQQDTQTLADGIAAAGITAEMLELDALGLETDVWAQDFFDIGYTSKPGPGGLPVGMKIAVRSAQPDRSAGEVTTKKFFGPDFGTVFKHLAKPASDHSYSMNSFGNWDVIPPYTKGTERYPLGRNYWGATDNAKESPDALFQDFVRAQRVQPEINVDTSWLAVGHVDEYSSWVKTNTTRGWGMLVASPRMARAMLMDLQAAGHGSAKMFETKTHYDWNKRTNVPAAISIDAVMKDANLMAECQLAQMKIDINVAKLQPEIGLDSSEITEIPFLIENSFGAGLAYQPGTVNLLFVDGKAVIPDPFGPTIDGSDPFKDDLRKRLGALGVQVFFADDWDTFHEGEGEVHCGTNVSRNLQQAWWESGR